MGWSQGFVPGRWKKKMASQPAGESPILLKQQCYGNRFQSAPLTFFRLVTPLLSFTCVCVYVCVHAMTKMEAILRL